MMCEACERGHHSNCGMQTWCECDCDPEAYDQYWPGIDDLPEEAKAEYAEED